MFRLKRKLKVLISFFTFEYIDNEIVVNNDVIELFENYSGIIYKICHLLSDNQKGMLGLGVVYDPDQGGSFLIVLFLNEKDKDSVSQAGKGLFLTSVHTKPLTNC